MKTYNSSSILITNRPECWYYNPDSQIPAVFFATELVNVEIHTQPAYAALKTVSETDDLTPELVRFAIDIAANSTLLKTEIGKKLLAADLEAMELLAETLAAL